MLSQTSTKHIVQAERISGSMLLSAGESVRLLISTNVSEAHSFGETTVNNGSKLHSYGLFGKFSCNLQEIIQ